MSVIYAGSNYYTAKSQLNQKYLFISENYQIISTNSVQNKPSAWPRGKSEKIAYVV